MAGGVNNNDKSLSLILWKWFLQSHHHKEQKCAWVSNSISALARNGWTSWLWSPSSSQTQTPTAAPPKSQGLPTPNYGSQPNFWALGFGIYPHSTQMRLNPWQFCNQETGQALDPNDCQLGNPSAKLQIAERISTQPCQLNKTKRTPICKIHWTFQIQCRSGAKGIFLNLLKQR